MASLSDLQAELDEARLSHEAKAAPLVAECKALAEKVDALRTELDDVEAALEAKVSELEGAPWYRASRSNISRLETAVREAEMQRDMNDDAAGVMLDVVVLRDFWGPDGARVATGWRGPILATMARKLASEGAVLLEGV